MQPRPGMVESFREYLRQRWDQGCHHGRELFAEVRQLGYVGCYSRLAQLLSPWRQPQPESKAVGLLPSPEPQAEATIQSAERQISPQVAAALLSKPRPELSARQAEIVDILKEQCPGFAVMRKLSFGFRSILCRGKVTTLHRCAGTLCPNRKAGPQRGGGSGDGELEQWAGGRSDQSPEGAEAADVWTSRGGVTSRPSATAGRHRRSRSGCCRRARSSD